MGVPSPHRAPRGRIPIKVVTMGALETQELLPEGWRGPPPRVLQSLRERARATGRGQGLGPYLDPRLIEDCVRATGLATMEDQVVVVDARPFHDPPGG